MGRSPIHHLELTNNVRVASWIIKVSLYKSKGGITNDTCDTKDRLIVSANFIAYCILFMLTFADLSYRL